MLPFHGYHHWDLRQCLLLWYNTTNVIALLLVGVLWTKERFVSPIKEQVTEVSKIMKGIKITNNVTIPEWNSCLWLIKWQLILRKKCDQSNEMYCIPVKLSSVDMIVFQCAT